MTASKAETLDTQKHKNCGKLIPQMSNHDATCFFTCRSPLQNWSSRPFPWSQRRAQLQAAAAVAPCTSHLEPQSAPCWGSIAGGRGWEKAAPLAEGWWRAAGSEQSKTALPAFPWMWGKCTPEKPAGEHTWKGTHPKTCARVTAMRDSQEDLQPEHRAAASSGL